MAIRSFDIQTSRRLSIGLLSASGALLFATLNLVPVVLSEELEPSCALLRFSAVMLGMSAWLALIGVVWSEIANHKSTPEQGHPAFRT